MDLRRNSIPLKTPWNRFPRPLRRPVTSWANKSSSRSIPLPPSFTTARNNVYVFKKSDGSKKTAEELIDYYAELCARFPIISIEDGCAENDWDGWKKLTDKLGYKIQLVGDDLFVTNVEFLRKGIAEHVANSILIKVNQIGTLTETLATIDVAKKNNYTTVISHRSG